MQHRRCGFQVTVKETGFPYPQALHLMLGSLAEKLFFLLGDVICENLMKDLLSKLNCKIKHTPEGLLFQVLGDFSIHNQIVSALDIPLLPLRFFLKIY